MIVSAKYKNGKNPVTGDTERECITVTMHDGQVWQVPEVDGLGLYEEVKSMVKEGTLTIQDADD